MSDLWKAVVIGASMLIPGVSGGTMAIIMDVYDKLIHAVSSFREKGKENFFFLLKFAIGGVIGMVLFSKPILALLHQFEQVMMYLFLGAIGGSIVPLYRKATINKIKPVNLAFCIAGFACCIGITLLPKGIFAGDQATGLLGIIALMFAGFCVAVAIVLPGISASYVLMMLGIYDKVLYAMGHLDFGLLLPLGIGALGGTFITAGILEKAMLRHPQFTYMMIIGFVIGSLWDVFPGLPQGNWFACMIAMGIGFAAILYMGSSVVRPIGHGPVKKR